MKTMGLNAFHKGDVELLKAALLFVILLLLWPLLQRLVLSVDMTAGYVDPSIVVLIVLSLICFVGMIWLSWWLTNRFWLALGLPGLGGMVLQFNSLLLWQQLGFYYASFALLLLAGVGCLVAIC